MLTANVCVPLGPPFHPHTHHSATMEDNGLQTIKTEPPSFVCVVPGCSNNNLNTKNVRFHSFPVTQTAQLWLAALGREAPPSSSQEALCSKHFRKADYLEDEGFQGVFKNFKTHRTLKPEAVPSILIPPFSRLQAKTTKEKEDVVKPPEAVPEEFFSQGTEHTPRFDKALGVLTQMFMKALHSSSNGTLDLDDVARDIKTSKRRIYDIINVLEGISLVKKKSKNVVQWVGWPAEFKASMSSLVVEETKLDELIRNTKQLIQETHEHFLNSRLAYLTYKDIQSLPIFEDQTVFVIKASHETKVEVAHPKEAFQIHIKSTVGPVEVLVCTDNLDISPNQSQSTKFADGDYSYVPLRGLSTAAVSRKDNANHNNTQSNTTSNSPSAPSSHLSQPLHTSPKSPSVLPTLEDQLNSSSPPSPPVVISIKEEMTNLNITPDEPIGNEPAQLTTDVHMTDLSKC